MKKIAALGILLMFLLANVATLSALETKTTNQNQLNESKNIQTLFSPGDGTHAHDVAVDSTDDIIVAGDYCTIKLDGDDGECIWGTLWKRTLVVVDSSDNIIFGGTSSYAKSYVITKYDKDLNLLFRTEYTRYDTQYLNTIVVDHSDDIIVSGWAYNGSNPGPSGPTVKWTLKVDGENGDILAESFIPSTPMDQENLVAVDKENNIIIVGIVWQTYCNFTLRKCDNKLIEQWNVTVDYPGYSFFPDSVVIDSQDNIIVCGSRTLRFDPQFNSSYFTVKYDKNGTKVWDSPVLYDNFMLDDKAESVAVDSQDNIIVFGYKDNPDSEYPGWHTIKYDPGGNELWYREIEYARCHRGNVAVDSSDNIICAGSTYGPGVEDDDKYLIVKYSENGDVLWIHIPSNVPPVTPELFGKTKGKVNVEYTYVSSTTDPDGDQVYYWFDWGDGNNSGWLGPYVSGEDVTATHSWGQKGDYTISVRAKDEIGFESGWRTLSVKMPRNRGLNSPLILGLLERFPHAFLILRHLLAGYKIVG